MGRFLEASVRSRILRQRVVAFVSTQSSDDLLALARRIEAGKVTPIVDRVYQLGETAEALRYLETGQARGKVVITI